MDTFFRKKRIFSPMIWLICLFLLLLPLSSCQKQIDYFDYVSELRQNIFLAEADGFSLRIYDVVKETPYLADGIPKETSSRVETYLVAPEGSETCHLTFSLNGKTHGGEMSFDNVKTEYYYTCSLSLSGVNTLECQIQHGETTLTLTARSVKTEQTLSPKACLKKLQETEGELFSSLTDKYGFSGEIYLRLLYEDAPYYYVGIIERTGKIHAFLLNAKTGKVLAKRES